MNLKRIIKEEVDDFNWVRDTPTNLDIAQGIVDKTRFWMLDGSLRVDLPFMSYYEGYPAKQLFKTSSLLKSESPTIMFLEYLLKNYGLGRTDYMAKHGIDPNASDIWFRYKNLITQKVLDNLKDKPINESDDFDWVRDVEVETDLTPAQLVHRFEILPDSIVGPYVEKNFADIKYENGRYYLMVDDWCDFKEWFSDRENGSQGFYMNQWIFKQAFCGEDDFFEPYSDVVYDWIDQVWELVEGNKELYNYVVDYITEDLVGEEMRLDGEEKILSLEDVLTWSADSDVLGLVINELDVFENLKWELGSSYENAYNTFIVDNMYKVSKDAITDVVGNGERKDVELYNSYNKSKYNANKLVFDVTSMLSDYLYEAIEYCIDNRCKPYWKPENLEFEEGETEVEAFEDYCDECMDHPFGDYGDFVSFMKDILEDNSDLLNPIVDEHPSNDEMEDYFIENVHGRF